jgi:peptide/nickel transport system substrate-binding protein
MWPGRCARSANPETGQPDPVRLWSTMANIVVEGNKVTADIASFDPTIFKWMSFLTGYILPKAYYESVGAEGFEAAPIGSGPYMVEKYERNAFVRLKANDGYWGEKPAFKTRDDQVRHRRHRPRGRMESARPTSRSKSRMRNSTA